MNEPDLCCDGWRAHKGYDAAAYALDFAAFRLFVKQVAPDMMILGPGGVGEGVSLAPIGLAGNMVKSEDILKATGPTFDIFSYHFLWCHFETLRLHGTGLASSRRCSPFGRLSFPSRPH